MAAVTGVSEHAAAVHHSMELPRRDLHVPAGQAVHNRVAGSRYVLGPHEQAPVTGSYTAPDAAMFPSISPHAHHEAGSAASGVAAMYSAVADTGRCEPVPAGDTSVNPSEMLTVGNPAPLYMRTDVYTVVPGGARPIVPTAARSTWPQVRWARTCVHGKRS